MHKQMTNDLFYEQLRKSVEDTIKISCWSSSGLFGLSISPGFEVAKILFRALKKRVLV